ncbi:MAG: MBL fold metallo-hydrolase [Bacillota bacterium]|jgi:hydroxyacylglutathione hydrolase
MKKNSIYFWGNYVSELLPQNLFFPVDTGKITENLFTVRDRDTNIYLYSDGKDTICFDVGYSNNNYLKEEFEKVRVNPDSISHLFLTHTDEDHAGAVDSDSKADWHDRAQLFLGREEAKLINKKAFRKMFFYTPVTISRPYRLLDDGEEVRVGAITVKALLTPGHTLGHMAYLINRRILISGDLLILKNGRAAPFYRIWNSNQRQIGDSLRKIARLDEVEFLGTAHSKYTVNFKEAVQDWI